MQTEIKVLANMAEHISNSISKSIVENTVSVNNSTDDPHVQNLDTVDLDNLFAFLTESTTSPSNPLIEEINDTMNSLVQDLDGEVSNCNEHNNLILYCFSIKGIIIFTLYIQALYRNNKYIF